jgi:hypothetical protein
MHIQTVASGTGIARPWQVGLPGSAPLYPQTAATQRWQVDINERVGKGSGQCSAGA